MRYILIGSLALILIMWIATRIVISRRKASGSEPPKPNSIDLGGMLEGAELVAYIRNEKLFLTVNGQWLFIQQLKDRLNYSTLTPWKARNYILTLMRKKDPDKYFLQKTEILKKYNLKGDKAELHHPFVEKMIRGSMMIKNQSDPD